MLRFFNPVMTQQALELRVEIFVVANAFEIVLLRHPLDSEDDKRDAQWTVGQDGLSDFLGRPDRFAVRYEACLELLRELLEQEKVGVFTLHGSSEMAARRVSTQP